MRAVRKGPSLEIGIQPTKPQVSFEVLALGKFAITDTALHFFHAAFWARHCVSISLVYRERNPPQTSMGRLRKAGELRGFKVWS